MSQRGRRTPCKGARARHNRTTGAGSTGVGRRHRCRSFRYVHRAGEPCATQKAGRTALPLPRNTRSPGGLPRRGERDRCTGSTELAHSAINLGEKAAAVKDEREAHYRCRANASNSNRIKRKVNSASRNADFDILKRCVLTSRLSIVGTVVLYHIRVVKCQQCRCCTTCVNIEMLSRKNHSLLRC